MLELLVEVETKLQAFLATIDSKVVLCSTTIWSFLSKLSFGVHVLFALPIQGTYPIGQQVPPQVSTDPVVDLARTRSTSLFLAYFNLNYIHLVLMITNFLRMRVDCIIHRHLRAQDSSVQDLQCCRYFLKIIFFPT